MRSTSVAIQLALLLSAPAFGQAQDAQKDVSAALASQSAQSTHITPNPEAPTLGPDSLRELLENRVFLDMPGDGAVWARGYTYKARFDSNGSAYIPDLGSDAPGHFPVQFQIAEITVGGEPLVLSNNAPVMGEKRVSFDRGPVVEVYDLSPNSVEQSFHFESLPTGGEIVIRLATETPLTARTVRDGFTFKGAHGGVHYGLATAFDARGYLSAAPTTLEGSGMIEIRVPAEAVARASFPLVVDPLITTIDVAVDPFPIESNPDVAFGADTGYAYYVFERLFAIGDSDILTVVVDPATGLIPSIAAWVDFTSDNWTKPRIAHNRLAGNFLVVAQEQSGSSSVISGRLRNEFTTTDAQFQVSGTEGGPKVDPDVGGDPLLLGPTYYMVVYTREAAFSSDSDIHARRVHSDGSITTPTIYLDNSFPSIDQHPRISKSNGIAPFSTQRWTVVWERENSAIDRNVRGAQLSWGGSIVTPSFEVAGQGFIAPFPDQRYPVVSTVLDSESGERNYLVAWQQRFGDLGSYSVRARMFAGPTGLSSTYSMPEVGGGQIRPAVDSDGSSFVIAYQRFGNLVGQYIRTTTMNAAGTILETKESDVPIDGGADYHTDISITSERSGDGQPQHFWLAYERSSITTFDSDILGAHHTSGGLGTSYCTGSPNSAGPGARINARGSISLAQESFTLEITGGAPNQPGIFYFGMGQIDTPFGEGRRCVGGFTSRVTPPAYMDGAGATEATLDFSVPYAVNLVAGSPGMNYQYWYRDPGVDSNSDGSVSGFNLSDALNVHHAP